MIKEKLAALSIILVILAVPSTVVWYQHTMDLDKYPSEAKVFDITGVAENGAWTLERVNGLNYWWKRFTPMTLHVNVGDQVVLKIQSADVFHQFYVPALNIGPIDVKPGHTVEVEFKAVKAGVYRYYCTSMCGGCHFYMSGWIVITPAGETPVSPQPIICPLCVPGFVERPEGDMVSLGEYLYLKMGCNTCHGNEGIGGVKNYNYIKDTVPTHNNTADKIFLKEKEDADTFIDLVIKNEDLDKLLEQTDISRFHLVLARYKAARDLIRKGAHCAKLDETGPEPPLQMPSWQAQLSERDIDAILVYFVSLFPWEDLEEEDEAWKDEF